MRDATFVMGADDTLRIVYVNTPRIARADNASRMTEPFERLKQAREKAGYDSPTDAARAFGWNEVTYRSHENGTRGIKAPIARQYGSAFRVPAEWLLYGDKSSRNGHDALGELPVIRIPFGGPLEAGAFREAEMYAQEEGEPVDVPRDRRFPKARQAAYLIKGDSMDLAGLLEGDYVVAIHYLDYCETQGEPPSGSKVIVERTTGGGHMIERTVKELHRSGPDFEFRPRSSNPRHKPFFVPRNHTADDGTTIAIIGVVSGVYRFI